MAQAFTDCKQSLSTATLLAHPVIGVDLALSTDAADFSIGACLQQRFRHLDFISQFTTDVRYVPGPENIPADTLSRIGSISSAGDFRALSMAQENDAELQELLRPDANTGLRLEKITIPGTNLTLYCDTTTGEPRPFVTPTLRRPVFNSLHNLSHPGIRATTKLVTDRFVWPNIKRDCRQWTRTCTQCQRTKIWRHNSPPLGRFAPPNHRFEHVHIDIVGPLPPSNGYRYLLTCIDRFTRWPEAFPLTNIDAASVAQTFVAGWISRFGTPLRLTNDQGRQFESELFRCLNKICGTTQFRTTAYHPAANGLVERLHRQLKASLTCHAETWTEALPLVLLGLRTAWRDDLQATTAELIYGQTLRLPGEFFNPSKSRLSDPEFIQQFRKLMNDLRPTPTSSHGNKQIFTFRDLETCSHVFLRHDAVKPPLQPAYDGPYKVLHRDHRTFRLLLNGRPTSVSTDRLKPAYVANEDPPQPTITPPNTATNTTDTNTKQTRSGRNIQRPVRFRDHPAGRGVIWHHQLLPTSLRRSQWNFHRHQQSPIDGDPNPRLPLCEAPGGIKFHPSITPGSSVQQSSSRLSEPSVTQQRLSCTEPGSYRRILEASYSQRSAQAQPSPPKATLTGVPESSFRQRPAPQQLRSELFILSGKLPSGTDALFR
ncbi:hypothetical protein GEV33_004491 [Tenebrio molitor]|uniref:Integrase catalytic domain-containing protein n=1 Tax=Tenebrio molitor TaxID=7067 RepID=A0A8J6LEE0_TENMO|nr:hypothetical protein GEV33_004491 [Tenebrio molitor]